MVYRRRKYYKRRYGRKRYYRRRSYRRRAKAVKRIVRGMAESKSTGAALPTPFGTITSTWSEHILLPAQGTQSLQRIGRQMEVTGIYLKGILAGGQSNTAADDKNNLVRIVIAVFQGSTSAMGQAKWPVLTDATTPIWIGKNASPQGAEIAYMKRKLFDRVYKLDSVGRDSTGYLPARRMVSIKLRFKKPIIYYFGNEASASVDKYIAVGMMSDSAVVPSPGFTSGSVIYTWKDI